MLIASLVDMPYLCWKLIVVLIHMRASTCTTIASAPAIPPPRAFLPAIFSTSDSFCFGFSFLAGVSAADDDIVAMEYARFAHTQRRKTPRRRALLWQIKGLGQIRV